jgi:oxygen-dependent protoporphyrinogen oxidase
MRLNDEDLLRITSEALSKLMEISGTPSYSRVDRWKNALPQYDLNHLQRVSQIEQQMRNLPGIALAGASYRGLGVPDCIRQGQEAARKALAFIQRNSGSARSNSESPAALHSAA